MTTKCCQNKAVLLFVYAERTRPRLPRPVRSRHHFREHISENHRGTSPRGYNRKAQLLAYSRHLRASALPKNDDHTHAPPSNASSLSSLPLTLPSRPPAKPVKQFSPLKNVVAAKKRKTTATPLACCSGWELFSMATLLKTPKGEAKKKRKKSNVSTTMKMKHLVKSQIRKNGNFMAKLLRAVQKHKNLMRERFKFNK